MKSVLLLPVFLMASSLAPGSTISYSTTFTGDFTFTSALVLPKFNVGSALLDKVAISIDGDVDVSIGYENRSPGATVNVTPWFSSAISAVIPGGIIALNLTPSSTGTAYNLSTHDGAMDFGGASGFTWNTTTLFAGSAETALPAHLAFFKGPGTFTVDLTGTGQTGFNNNTSPRWLAFGDTTPTVNVNVTYSFTSIPEPATLALAGFSLSALVLLRKRI